MSTLIPVETEMPWPAPAAFPPPTSLPPLAPNESAVLDEAEEPEVFPDLWCCHAFEGDEARGFVP